jgi:hypothetical protein
MAYLLNHPWLFGLIFAISLAVAIELGRYTAAATRLHEEAHRKEQIVAIRDGLFLLVSLLLGFTLALAVPRYNERHALLVEEATSIGTTYLRADTLPEPFRDNARDLLRKYVDSRLDYDNAGGDTARLNEALNRSTQIQSQLWGGAAALAQTDRSGLLATYVNSLNETIDLREKRIAAVENRIPVTVWFLIFSVSLIAFFSRGLTLTRGFWVTLILAPITIAIVLALVADLDSPGTGLIRRDERPMYRLKTELNSQP